MTAHELAGSTALVTGAGNGLGRAISRRLAAAGARVILVGRSASRLASVAAELPGQALVAPCDVACEKAVSALAASLTGEEVSILVNNAGIPGPVRSLTDVGADEWDEVFAVNVRGPFLLCRAFMPAMVGRGAGNIINIASVTGKRPLPGRTPYAASKMALIGLTSAGTECCAPPSRRKRYSGRPACALPQRIRREPAGPEVHELASRFSLRQPPARLLAMMCWNMVLRAGALMASPWRMATVRAVLLSWPAVMIPSGSGTMAPS